MKTCCMTSAGRFSAASIVRSWASTARARPRCCRCCTACCGRRRAAFTGTGPTGRRVRPLWADPFPRWFHPRSRSAISDRAGTSRGRELLLTGFEDTPLLYTTTTEEAGAGPWKTWPGSWTPCPLLGRQLPEMSQGQLRILLLGRALLRRPALLLLDECVDGLDMGHRRRFFTTLEALTQAAGPGHDRHHEQPSHGSGAGMVRPSALD